jgi:glutamate-1-semialdehyde aminotransferase
LVEELVTVNDVAAHLAARPSLHEGAPPGTAGTAALADVAATVGSAAPASGGVPASDLRSILEGQLDLMQRQLDLLTRARSAHAGRGGARGLQPPRSLPPQLLPARPQTASGPAQTALPVQRHQAASAREAVGEVDSPAPRHAFVPYQPIDRSDRSAAHGLTEAQREHLDRLIVRLAARTRRSRELAQSWRQVLANSRASAGFRLLWKELIYPLVGQRGAGSHIWDVDGNEYVDLTMGFGSLLFGHSPDFLRQALADQLALGVQIGPESETAGEVAGLIRELTGAERVTFCNSGTEAVMVALRLARAVSGRAKIALFSGSFHGTFDGLLAQGERLEDGRLRAVPLAPGIPRSLIADVLVLDYESADALAEIESHAGELAAVLVEPRQSRRPDLDRRDFLRQLRQLTERAGIALIFDEVVTGFRVHPGGIQALYGVRADITTYGKAIANGMPIGVVAGRAAYLDAIDGGHWRYGDQSLPEAGTTFFGGTFFRHPLVMAAALACLRQLRANPGLQEELDRRTARLVARLEGLLAAEGLPLRISSFSSLFLFHFPDWTSRDLFFFHLLARGIYVWESRICYLSTAHSDDDLAAIFTAVRDSLREMRAAGFLGHALPLTEDQRELWELSQRGAAASQALNLALALHLRGPLDRTALERSLLRLAGRHAALRAVFAADGASQTIGPAGEVKVAWTKLAPGADAATLLAAEARRPFDLAAGPLLRFHLLRLADHHHILGLFVHHLVIDGSSFGCLLGELTALYAAEVNGEHQPLAEPEHYGRAVEAVMAREKSPAMREHEEFWLEHLSPPPPPLSLPADRPRPPRRTFGGGTRTLRLDAARSAALRALAARLGCTTPTLLLTAVVALLHRLSGQDDMVIGMPVAGHPAGSAALVGYFLHLPPLRFRIAAGSTFAQLAAATRRVVLDAHDHREVPLSRLVRRLGLVEHDSRPPLISALFNCDSSSPLAMAGLEAEVHAIPTGAAEFEVFWNAVLGARGLAVECIYNSDLFLASSIDRWLAGLESLLQSVLSDPDLALADLALTPAAERGSAVMASREAL